MKKISMTFMAGALLLAPAVAPLSPSLASPAAIVYAEDADVDVSLHFGYAAPHGERSIALVSVLTDSEGKVLQARMDELQYVEGDDWTGIPNSDDKFGESYPEDQVLASKRENDDAYSSSMEEKAEATLKYSESLDAIEDFVKGKTVEEIRASITEIDELGEDSDVSEVVSGSTFVDTAGYLAAVADTVESGQAVDAQVDSLDDLNLHQALGATGGRAVGVASVLLEGDVVRGVYLDELAYMDQDSQGVPNSDKAFGEGVQDDQVLASKRENSEAYTEELKEKAEATLSYDENVDAIEDFALGKTLAELEEAVQELEDLGEDGDVSEVVSGATFVRTAEYLKVIIDAMQ